MKPGIEDWYRLIDRVRTGEPLPPKAREFAADVLELVRQGIDPREFAGTVPDDSRRNRRAIVGLHYWLLRAKFGQGGEAAARKAVGTAWCLSPSRVKTIGRNCAALKEGAYKAKDAGSLDQILAAIVQESPQGSRKRKNLEP